MESISLSCCLLFSTAASLTFVLTIYANVVGGGEGGGGRLVVVVVVVVVAAAAAAAHPLRTSFVSQETS